MTTNQELTTLMRDLTEAPGIAGYETAVRQLMLRHLEPLGVIHHDNLGGIACCKAGKAERPRIMLAAHMDEVGFIVSSITKEGFLKFEPFGGWFDQVLLAQRVEVITRQGSCIGVIGSTPPHLMPMDKRDKMVKQIDMFIDIGASSKEEAEKWGIRPGDAIVPVSSFTSLHNENMLLAKAWDDRIGCVLVIEVLRQLQQESHPNTVYGAATVQEEVGLRGAETMANLIAPDIGLVLESNPASDTPNVSSDQPDVALQAGPVLSIYDRSMIGHLGLRQFVETVAETETIAVQYRTSRGGTDGGKIHLHGTGVPSLVIGVPTRYIHSHNAILHLDDVGQTAKLIVAIIKRLDSAAVERLKA